MHPDTWPSVIVNFLQNHLLNTVPLFLSQFFFLCLYCCLVLFLHFISSLVFWLWIFLSLPFSLCSLYSVSCRSRLLSLFKGFQGVLGSNTPVWICPHLCPCGRTRGRRRCRLWPRIHPWHCWRPLQTPPGESETDAENMLCEAAENMCRSPGADERGSCRARGDIRALQGRVRNMEWWVSCLMEKLCSSVGSAWQRTDPVSGVKELFFPQRQRRSGSECREEKEGTRSGNHSRVCVCVCEWVSVSVCLRKHTHTHTQQSDWIVTCFFSHLNTCVDFFFSVTVDEKNKQRETRRTHLKLPVHPRSAWKHTLSTHIQYIPEVHSSTTTTTPCQTHWAPGKNSEWNG